MLLFVISEAVGSKVVSSMKDIVDHYNATMLFPISSNLDIKRQSNEYCFLYFNSNFIGAVKSCSKEEMDQFTKHYEEPSRIITN